MKLLLAFIISAHASWWSDFCEKHLIGDDPYQYEQVATSWIEYQIDKLEVKERWGKLSRAEASQLKILRAERARRS